LSGPIPRPRGSRSGREVDQKNAAAEANLLPATVRGLIVHASTWTSTMAQDRGQHRHPPLQLGDALPQGGLATVCLDERDDLPDPAADPAHRRRAGDLQFREELRIPRADDLLLDSVVVGAARAMAHLAIRPWSSRPVWSTK